MKTTTMRFLLLLAIGSVLFLSARAGDLEPPGPPAPTMVTLQEIFDKLDALGGVPKTGQTGCWLATGAPIPCAGTGQDGDHRAGVSVGQRFTDNGDGTVKDNLTGLVWLKDANCFGLQGWTDALSDANGLANGSCGLTDGSVAGDWRLSNVKELQSLIDFGEVFPALPPGHPFSGVGVQSVYWSSTTHQITLNFAWLVEVEDGRVTIGGKALLNTGWPVRGGS